MINEYRILENDEGGEFFPATITDVVGHSQTKTSLTNLINRYNVTTIKPLEQGSYYGLSSAISYLDGVLLSSQKKPGVILEFTNSSGIYEEWEFIGGEFNFTDEAGWRQTDSSVILELQKTIFPITATLTANIVIVQTNTSNNVVFSWHVFRKGLEVTSLATKTFNETPVASELTETTVNISENSYMTKTYPFTATYQGLTKTVTASVVVVDPTYYGMVNPGVTLTEGVIKSLNSRLSGQKSFTWSGINLNNQKSCLVYPQYLGALTSIKDANNFEYIESYTKDSITMSGVAYYVYVLTVPTTITDFKQIYS